MADHASGASRLVTRFPGPALVVAAILWAGGGLISRAAPISGPGLAFWRCLLAAVIYQGVLAIRGVRPSLAGLRASWLGGLGFGLSVVCLFIAYKTTTLVSATVIGSLQPLLLGVVAHRTSHRLDRLLWASSGVAALGTVIVVLGSSTDAGTWSLRGDLFAAGAVAANMLYVVGTKRARATLGGLEFQASMLWAAAVCVAPIAWFTHSGHFVPDATAWRWILALVAVGGTGHVVYSVAQRHVSVAASSAILLAEVLGVSIGAVVFFDQSLGAVQVIGMALVAGAVGVWLARAPVEGVERSTALETVER